MFMSDEETNRKLDFLASLGERCNFNLQNIIDECEKKSLENSELQQVYKKLGVDDKDSGDEFDAILEKF